MPGVPSRRMDRCTRLPEEPRMRAMRAGEVRADVGAVDAHDLIAGEDAGLARRASPRWARRIFTTPICGDHLDADARVGAHGAEADLFEFLVVEVGRVRIERGDHAAHGLLHEGVIVDVIDVLALDALVDFREQARLLPVERGHRGARRLARALRQHAARQRPAESEHDAGDESDQRARSRDAAHGPSPCFPVRPRVHRAAPGGPAG